MSDVVRDSITAIEKRIRELRPHLEEHERLQRALAALRATTARTSTGRNSGRRSAAPKRAAAARRRAGRPRKGQPTRRQQFVALIDKQPGITVTQAAKKLRMPKPNALYSVARELTDSRTVRKQGAGYYPASDGRGPNAKTTRSKNSPRRRQTPAKTTPKK